MCFIFKSSQKNSYLFLTHMKITFMLTYKLELKTLHVLKTGHKLQ